MSIKQIFIKDLLEKFGIDFEIPLFILYQEVPDVFVKCKKKYDSDKYDYYYELKSKDKKFTMIVTPDTGEDGEVSYRFQPSRGSHCSGEGWEYHGDVYII